MTKAIPHIVLVAAGTGGHIFPAWTVGQAFLAKNTAVSWITDARGAGYPNAPDFTHVLCLKMPPLSGTWWKKGVALLYFGKSFLQALFFLKKQKPQVVWGFGGYASLPSLLAAWVLRIPRGLHQADALLGKANRFLARFCPDLAISFPVTKGVPKKVHQTYTGLPLRAQIEALSQDPYPVRTKASDPFHLLVIGGSQGTVMWSKHLPQALALLPVEKQNCLHILHQCRLETLAQTQEAYAQTHVTVALTPFIQDMASALAKAHLVMTRAGASSVMELAASGRPALFVPYPFAAEDHQTLNAQYVVAQEGAWMMAEKDLSPLVLKEFLEAHLESSAQLQHHAKKIKRLWQKDATTHLVELITQRAQGVL